MLLANDKQIQVHVETEALIYKSCQYKFQDKVYQELIETVGFIDRLPTYQELQHLPYMKMCIKESLRLYPSVPLISRVSSEEIITPSGYKIPEGSQIMIHIYDLQRNPDIYPDPEKFDPERFLLENCINRHPFAFLPFSGGPRNCIGNYEQSSSSIAL